MEISLFFPLEGAFKAVPERVVVAALIKKPSSVALLLIVLIFKSITYNHQNIMKAVMFFTSMTIVAAVFWLVATQGPLRIRCCNEVDGYRPQVEIVYNYGNFIENQSDWRHIKPRLE